MNPRGIAFVACRLFAAYLLVANVLSGAMILITGVISGNSDFILPQLTALILYLFISGLLWFGASWLARRISESGPADGAASHVDADRWQALLFSAVGIGNAMIAVQIALQAFRQSIREGGGVAEILIVGLTYFLISALLILFPHVLVRWIRHVRAFAGGLRARH